MKINEVNAIRISNIAENERIYVTIVNDGHRVVIEPISSLDEDFVEDETLNNLGVGDMTRSFDNDEDAPNDFVVIVRMK